MEVLADGETEYGKFLKFAPLTLCPIDKTPILPELLTFEQRKWLDDYHATVYQALSPYLNQDECACCRRPARLWRIDHVSAPGCKSLQRRTRRQA